MNGNKQPLIILWSDGSIDRMQSIPAGLQLDFGQQLVNEVRNATLPANPLPIENKPDEVEDES